MWNNTYSSPPLLRATSFLQSHIIIFSGRHTTIFNYNQAKGDLNIREQTCHCFDVMLLLAIDFSVSILSIDMRHVSPLWRWQHVIISLPGSGGIVADHECLDSLLFLCIFLVFFFFSPRWLLPVHGTRYTVIASVVLFCVESKFQSGHLHSLILLPAETLFFWKKHMQHGLYCVCMW